MIKSSRICIIMLIPLFLSLTVISQTPYNSIVNEIKTRGGIEFGQLQYKLEPPGWWQYYPSCDASKWISVGQNFKKRDDYKARCDLQVHDYKTEVEPTLSETTELIIPADGHLIIFCEVNEAEGYEKENHLYGTVYPQNGNEWRVHSIVGGKNRLKPHPSNSHFGLVYKGDKVVLKIEERIRTDAYRRFFIQSETTLRAFLFPRDGQTFSPADIQAAKQSLNSSYGTNNNCDQLKKALAAHINSRNATIQSISDIQKQINALGKHSPYNTGYLNEYQNNTLGNDPVWNKKNLQILKSGAGGGSVEYLYFKDKWINSLNKSIEIQTFNLEKINWEISKIQQQLQQSSCK